MTSLSERRNNNDDANSHQHVNNDNPNEHTGHETLLHTVRMNSLLDKEMMNTNNNNFNNKDDDGGGGEDKSDCNYENNNQQSTLFFDTTANLSPSSMEVTFSDPQKYDHSSFSKRQSTIGRTIVTNSRHNNINDSPLLHADDNTNYCCDDDEEVEEEEFRDDYIRSGTHFRSLLDQAFHKVANNFSNYDRLDKINENEESSNVIRGGGGGGGDSSLEVFQNGIHENQHFRHNKLGKRLLAQDVDESNCSSRPLRRQKVSSEIDDEIDSGSNRLTAQLARQKMTEVLSLKRVSFIYFFNGNF